MIWVTKVQPSRPHLLHKEKSVMPRSYAESQKQLTKESITTSLFLLLKEKDYAGITITDITKKAGVSRMAFYRNYNEKDQVIEEHMNQIYEQFFTKIGSLPARTPETISFELVGYFDKYSGLFAESLARGYNQILFHSFARALGDFYKSTVTWDNYEGTRAHYWNTFMAAGLFYVFMNWIERGKAETVNEMAELITELNT
ncbi:TetR/AcrR family transcriptional regulator [Paenibacillus thalictri]|uniref:TetR/AcrR family transcriptional regulator n=1 Tax=Paenibacillus thalictri TaxID=2527873 RepID=A0A4Q9DR18_9BACL|nr:TetR/AcrR family transcriptional regulator [Paenibacillus thalictri]TBL77354.1 TetR/AcrR family transcriptional regulator [Paenibacillus thalictri]